MERRAGAEIDIAIVGGGVAGIYCAYRLGQGHPDKVIHLYEQSGRFGGRLWSTRMLGGGPPLDLGAMSFSDAHENLFGLIDALKLPVTPIALNSKSHFLRGRLLNEEMYADAQVIPYRLEAEEQGKRPCELALHALRKIVEDLPRLWPFAESSVHGQAEAAAQRLRDLEVRGRPLHDWGLWNLLSETVSNEAYELLTATLGSAGAFRNINAHDAISTLMWEAHPHQRHYRLTHGFQQLPLALKHASEEKVEFAAFHRLKRIVMASGRFRLHFETPHGESAILARALILALPQRALHLVEYDPELVDCCFHSDLETVSPAPACKLFMGFAAPWWDADARAAEAKGEIGVSYTDLPMRQCYYYQREAPGEAALLMAAYADDVASSFWSALVGPNYRDTRSQDWLADDDASLCASTAMVENARRQLALINGRAHVDAPLGAVFIDWSRDPYGGAWHSWRPYVRSWEARERIRMPNKKWPLFICGEAFAQRQGWTEGTINNAEVMLERHFGLARPVWVRGDYPFEY